MTGDLIVKRHLESDKKASLCFSGFIFQMEIISYRIIGLKLSFFSFWFSLREWFARTRSTFIFLGFHRLILLQEIEILWFYIFLVFYKYYLSFFFSLLFLSNLRLTWQPPCFSLPFNGRLMDSLFTFFKGIPWKLSANQVLSTVTNDFLFKFQIQEFFHFFSSFSFLGINL